MEAADDFLKMALQIAEANARSGKGGPFGAVIVKDGIFISSGSNEVTETPDPTAHAEIVAIRKACTQLSTFNLEGCELYTSCYPCPMCLGAIYWAGIRTVYYANTTEEAAAIGFADQHIVEELGKPDQLKSLRLIHMTIPDTGKAFRLWQENPGKIPY